jgi:hypothetical protein
MKNIPTVNLRFQVSAPYTIPTSAKKRKISPVGTITCSWSSLKIKRKK